MACPTVQTFRFLAITVGHTSPMNVATRSETTESRNHLVIRENPGNHEIGTEILKTHLVMPGNPGIIVNRTTVVETDETILIRNVE